MYLLLAFLPLPAFVFSKNSNVLRISAAILFITVAILLAPTKTWQGAPFSRFSELEIAFYSCSAHVSNISFCQNNDILPQSWSHEYCVCTNENAFSTIAYCYATGYPHEESSLISRCNSKFGTSWDQASFDQALAYYKQEAQISNSQTLDHPLQHPLRLSETEIMVYRRSYDQFLGNYNRSVQYGFYLVLFWALVFTLAAVGNWTKILYPRLAQLWTGKAVLTFRRYVSLPATVGRWRTNERPIGGIFDLLVPTRAETLILLAFTVLTAHFSIAKISAVDGDPIYPMKKQALFRYYGVRLGILASYLAPLSILFAGRNNVLQWFTRWEYSTFVMFHRWISRILVLLILIHSFAYGALLYLKRRHALENYVYWGIAGTVSGVAILVQGMLVLRRRWYEAFLALHILLAAIFIGGGCFHVANLRFLSYYYCTACLWILDRVIRLQRIFLFGFPEAKVQLFEDLTLKVTVPKPSLFRSEGGGHCFIHFLRWPSFWQSHPFTYTEMENSIVFYVKVKDGVTTSLRRFLEKNPDKSARMRIAVEGSYGEASPASKYDASVFIAGGNGIPGIYAELVEAARENRVSEPDSPKKVVLVWVVREYSSLLWFYNELLALEHSGIEVRIYVTRPSSKLLSRADDRLALLHNTYTYYHATENDPIGHLKQNLPHVSFFECRPDIHKLVSGFAEEVSGSIAFVTCGHPIMVDDIRHEVVELIAKRKNRIDYFEQLQVWA